MEKLKDDEKDLKPIYLNYKRNNKWMGIIDYKSLCVILGYAAVVGYIISLFNIDLELKVCIFIALIIPFAGVISININNESTIDMLKTILKYTFMPKKYIYYENGVDDKEANKYKPTKYINLDK